MELGYAIFAQVALVLVTGTVPMLFLLNRLGGERVPALSPARSYGRSPR